MTARIYRPARNAMQSGQAKTVWVLQFEPETPRQIEPLMGWTSSTDMRQQIRMTFETKEEAIAYATREGIAFHVEEPGSKAAKPGASYSDNFKFNRVGQWTH
jgi:hypothetical protein